MNRVALVLTSLCVLVSCGTLEIGIERTELPQATATAAAASVTETAPSPTPTAAELATPVPTQTLAIPSPTPAPIPTSTPTPAQEATGSPWGDFPPGLVYRLSDALWVVDGQGEPVQVASNANAALSPDGTSLVSYDLADQDPWLLDRTTGTGYSLTQTPDRLECCFQWWSEKPGVLVFGSLDNEIERGPGVMGNLGSVSTDGMAYRLLDAEHDIGPGGFALSPGGQSIAYGGGSTGWLYRWNVGSEPFDPSAYGLFGTKGVQIGSPAWSPDGTRLAWVVGGGFAVDGDHRIGVAVFDLVDRTATLVHSYVPLGRGGWPPAPTWSPDGRWLAFEAWARDDEEAGVWVVQVDGLGEEKHHLGQGSHAVWSPEGEQMAFYRIPRGGEPGIWIARSSMRELYPLGLPPDAALAGWIEAGPELSGAVPLSVMPPPAETPTVPQIRAFQVEPTTARPGDVVTLTWEASGDQATICPSARFVLFTSDDCWQVPLSGTTTFTIPLDTGGNRAVDFFLRVHADGTSEPAMWQASVALECDTTWFFSDAPQAGICPLEAIESHAVTQQFEHGTMVWIEQLGRYIILMEASPPDGKVLGPVAYLQDPLNLVRDSSADTEAPEGLYAPANGFGLIWRGDVTGSPGYCEVLGWGLGPAFEYDALFQCDDALPSGGRSWQTCYLQGPDGEIIVLDPLGRWYLWGGWNEG